MYRFTISEELLKNEQQKTLEMKNHKSQIQQENFESEVRKYKWKWRIPSEKDDIIVHSNFTIHTKANEFHNCIYITRFLPTHQRKWDFDLDKEEIFWNVRNFECYTSSITHYIKTFLYLSSPSILDILKRITTMSKDVEEIPRMFYTSEFHTIEFTTFIKDNDDYVDPKYIREATLSIETNVTFRPLKFFKYYPHKELLVADTDTFLPISQLGIIIKPNNFPVKPPENHNYMGHSGGQHNIKRLNYNAFYTRSPSNLKNEQIPKNAFPFADPCENRNFTLSDEDMKILIDELNKEDPNYPFTQWTSRVEKLSNGQFFMK
jgi:hypothetical protein